MDATEIKDNGARSFRMPSIDTRGFALGHRSGNVSLSVSLSNGSFSLDPMVGDEARALARAILDAADFADAEKARASASNDPVEAEPPKAAPAGPVMHPLVSTNIASAGHDGTDLYVAFKSGGTYRYEAVPVSTFEAMLDAKSAGSFLHANIKGKFTAVKVESAAAAQEPRS